MALASYLNSRVVGGFGLRRVGHTAAAAFAFVTAIHAAIALTGYESLWTFIVMQGLTMACFAFTSSNLGTLAMENMAPIAGTASSVQGVVSTIGAAAIGFLIGQQFNGTPVPFVVGTALCAAGGFVLIVLTEPKRLFARIESREEPPCIAEDFGLEDYSAAISSRRPGPTISASPTSSVLPRIAFSIRCATSGFSLRYFFAFSRPWPMRTSHS